MMIPHHPNHFAPLKKFGIPKAGDDSPVLTVTVKTIALHQIKRATIAEATDRGIAGVGEELRKNPNTAAIYRNHQKMQAEMVAARTEAPSIAPNPAPTTPPPSARSRSAFKAPSGPS